MNNLQAFECKNLSLLYIYIYIYNQQTPTIIKFFFIVHDNKTSLFFGEKIKTTTYIFQSRER